MVDKNKIIKTAMKAFETADFSSGLTYRAFSVAAKRLIEYGFKASDHQGRFGRDFKWQNTKRLAKHTADLNAAVEKIVEDLLSQIDEMAKKSAVENIGEVPESDFDKEDYLGALLFSDTFKSRTRKHTEKLKQEVLDFIRVGQENKLPADKVFEIYLENIKEPQKHELIVEAIMSGYVTMSGMSALKSQSNLNVDMLVRGFYRANSHYFGKAEAFYVLAQQDAYTCDICKDLHLRVFDIKEEVLPAHMRCRCIPVPLLKRKDFENI